MIKLDIKPNCGRYFNNHLRCLLRLEFELEKLGITFVTGRGDVQLIQIHQDTDYVSRILDNNVPTIIQDLFLGPELFWWGIRKHMLRDNVKVVLKTSKFVDSASYDIKFPHNHMRHVSIITNDETYVEYDISLSHLYYKIDVFANIIAWDYFSKTKWDNVFCTPPLDHPKNLDASIMLGDINTRCYPSKDTRNHRYLALDAMYRLKDQYKVFLRMPNIPYINRTEYYKILTDSKVCLSPWGHDITCWRDYEAALCGAVVVKPDTSFAISWPEIPYVECRPDFSDFREILGRILANFDDYEDMRTRAYLNAMGGKDDVILAKRLSRIIKSCLE